MDALILGFIGAGNMNSAILNGGTVPGAGRARTDLALQSQRRQAGLFSETGRPYDYRKPPGGGAGRRDRAGRQAQMFGDVLPELGGLAAGKCVVSIAAGVSTAYLREMLPGRPRRACNAQHAADGGGGRHQRWRMRRTYRPRCFRRC